MSELTGTGEPQVVRIGDRRVGRTDPPYVVAELSANHGGHLRKALDLVKAAADSGADAIKLQTFTPESMTLDSRSAPFIVTGGTPWDGRPLHELYAEAQTPFEWHEKIASAASESGIAWFSTPFDTSAVEFLEGLDVPAYKIASFEILDHVLIETASSKNKPVIISTGMATRDEIDEAVTVARNAGTGGVILLRCSSAYPAPSSTLDLRTILDMEQRWETLVGFSDHTIGPTSAIAAVALGACLVEKHLTIRRADGGPDAAFSCEPDEFEALVNAVHNASESLGEVRYGPNRDEAASVKLRRSLWFVADLEVGDVISQDAVRSLRPASGLPPKHLGEVIGRHAVRQIKAGTPVGWDLLD
jgi:N-acetylneuraminate synthase